MTRCFALSLALFAFACGDDADPTNPGTDASATTDAADRYRPVNDCAEVTHESSGVPCAVTGATCHIDVPCSSGEPQPGDCICASGVWRCSSPDC